MTVVSRVPKLFFMNPYFFEMHLKAFKRAMNFPSLRVEKFLNWAKFPPFLEVLMFSQSFFNCFKGASENGPKSQQRTFSHLFGSRDFPLDKSCANKSQPKVGLRSIFWGEEVWQGCCTYLSLIDWCFTKAWVIIWLWDCTKLCNKVWDCYLLSRSC